MPEAVIVAVIVNIALIIVALINNRKLTENNEKIKKVATSTQATNQQFLNNGGSTIKDQMDRIENRFIAQDERMNLLQQADHDDRASAQEAHTAIYRALEVVGHTVTLLGEEIKAHKEDNDKRG